MPHKATVSASAPGSLMLLGEYAVLSGKPALVCAVDKRISVTLTPREDHVIEIFSETLGAYQTNIAALSLEKPFNFVLGALLQHKSNLKHGYDIHVISDFSHTIGLGSSAAVTVATLAALATSLELNSTPHDLIQQGCEVIRAVQGMGSGADIAASVHGGMVHYQAAPLNAEKLSATYPLTLWYSGSKTPTAEAIKKVQTEFAHQPALFHQLTNTIGECAQQGIECVRAEQWDQLGRVMNIQQGLMESLGVNMPILREMVDRLRKDNGILGAKISGSGLGDCVVGLGRIEDHAATHQFINIPINISSAGVYCEKV